MPTRRRHSDRPRRLSGTVVAAAVTVAVAAALSIGRPPARAEGLGRVLPTPAVDVPVGDGVQTAVLSGGCFWGVQGVFEHVRGVRKVLAGYAEGAAATAHYEAVSRGNTGHAESVQ